MIGISFSKGQPVRVYKLKYSLKEHNVTLFSVSIRWNISAGIGAALTVMTRYSGGHFFLFFPSIVFLPKGNDLSLKAFGVLMGIPLITLILWMIRNVLVAEDLTGRSGVSQSAELYVLFDSLVRTVAHKWAFGEQFPSPELLTIVILAFPLVGLLQRTSSYISLAYVTSMALIIFSRLFVDAEIPMNERILFVPFVLSMTLIIGVPGGIIVTGFGHKIFLSVLSVAIIGFGITRKTDQPQATAFESQTWQQTESIGYLESRSVEGAVVYTNAKDFLLLYGNLDTRTLPRRYDAGSREELEGSLEVFKQELEEIRKESASDESQEILFAFFDLVSWRWYLWEEAALVEELKLEKVEETGNTRIYKLPLEGIKKDEENKLNED